VKRDRGAEHGAHGCKAGAAQETATIGMGNAAEECTIGFGRVFLEIGE
jgi:hypothetical protein